jgi:hypothetical protein
MNNLKVLKGYHVSWTTVNFQDGAGRGSVVVRGSDAGLALHVAQELISVGRGCRWSEVVFSPGRQAEPG